MVSFGTPWTTGQSTFILSYPHENCLFLHIAQPTCQDFVLMWPKMWLLEILNPSWATLNVDSPHQIELYITWVFLKLILPQEIVLFTGVRPLTLGRQDSGIHNHEKCRGFEKYPSLWSGRGNDPLAWVLTTNSRQAAFQPCFRQCRPYTSYLYWDMISDSSQVPP